MGNETSEGFSGAIPAVPSEGHTDVQPVGPEPSGGTDQSATTAPPEVATEGHTDVDPVAPEPSGGEAQSATAAPPTVASTVSSSPDLTQAGTLTGGGEAAAGYSGTEPTLAADPTEPLETQLEHVGSAKGGQSSGGYSSALPAVASTPSPGSFGPGGTYH